MGGIGEVSAISKQDLDGVKAQDIDFRLSVFGNRCNFHLYKLLYFMCMNMDIDDYCIELL